MSHREVARDTAEAGVTRLIRTLAIILPSVALVQVLVNSRDYRQPAVAIVVWLAVLGAGAWLVPRLRAGGLGAGETAAAILITVAAVASVGAVHRTHGASGGVDLAIFGAIWLLALVVMSHSPRVWIPAALLVCTVQGAFLIRDGGLNSLSLSELAAAGYIVAALLSAFAVLRPTLDLRVSMAVRQASLASRSAAERAAAAAILQERQRRLAVLEKEALPLLRGIADGTLDPADVGVREECARHATALRHSLTGGTPGGELLAGLQPALRGAADRKMPLTVQVIGNPGTPQPPVTRAVLAVIDTVISALPPQQLILTVLAGASDGCDNQPPITGSLSQPSAREGASGGDVELYLTFSAPLRAAPDLTQFGLDIPASACWRASVSATETGGGCLEVSWRKGGLAQGRKDYGA